MLLSQENLLVLKNNLHANTNDQEGEEQSKLERIKSFIHEQSLHSQRYKSPNHHHSNSSISSDYEEKSSIILVDSKNGGDNDSLFSASISQIIPRRQKQHPMHHDNRPQQHNTPSTLFEVAVNHHDKILLPQLPSSHTKQQHGKKQSSPSPSPCHKKRRIKSSSNTSDEINTNKKPLLPQTTANGFHLLQKFVSPNLEMNRITIKSNNGHKRPKLGLFNKGKSSAKATKAVPDLVFSESKFLKRDPRPNQSHYYNNISPSYVGDDDESTSSIRHHTKNSGHHKRQTSISRFFQHKSSHHEEESQEHRSFTTTSLSSVRINQQQHRAAPPPPLLMQQQQPIKAKHMDPNKSIVEISSSSSNQSIERILRECKNAPQVVFNHRRKASYESSFYHAYNNMEKTRQHHQPQQQVPTYPRVKTPNNSIPIMNKNPIISIASSNSSSSHDEAHSTTSFRFNDDDDIDKNTPPSTSEATLLLYYKNHLNNNGYSLEEDEELELYEEQQTTSEHHRSLVAGGLTQQEGYDGLLDWQIESVASFENNGDTTTAINEKQNHQLSYENDDPIFNFWKYQYKRAL